jgi:hypothetical protein
MSQQKLSIKTDNGSKIMRVLELLTPLNGTTAPTVNATFLGQKYIDTVAKVGYESVAVGSETPADDWKQTTNA